MIGLASAPLVGLAMPAHAGSQQSTASAHAWVVAAKALTRAAFPPPGAKPAGQGALPRREPAAPSVPSNLAVISRDVLTDAFISAAVLACLLVPIMWYGSIMKRRDRMVALAAADRAQHSMLGSGGRAMGADPLLDFFGPQEEPAGIAAGSQRPIAAPKYQPRPALSGRSTLTPAFAPRPMLAAPHPTDEDSWSSPPAWGSRSQTPEPEAWDDARDEDSWAAPSRRPAAERDDRARGQDHGQSSTLRHAPVAGTPPWEPAPEPTGELPWAVLSGSARGGGPNAGSGRPNQVPPESGWYGPPASHSAPPSPLFDPDPEEEGSNGSGAGYAQRHVPGPDRRADSDWRSIPGRRAGSGERPIYIWDPEKTADSDGTNRLATSYEG
ncbi:MAG TPA: hypothetical protein VJT16_11425 [Streptosporangiaceae bacterium]|nr:hypothetical protein [Streptosporangiaceae bacterium]